MNLYVKINRNLKTGRAYYYGTVLGFGAFSYDRTAQGKPAYTGANMAETG